MFLGARAPAFRVAVAVYVFPGFGVDEAYFVGGGTDDAPVLPVDGFDAFVGFAFPQANHLRYSGRGMEFGTGVFGEGVEVDAVDGADDEAGDELGFHYQESNSLGGEN